MGVCVCVCLPARVRATCMHLPFLVSPFLNFISKNKISCEPAPFKEVIIGNKYFFLHPYYRGSFLLALNESNLICLRDPSFLELMHQSPFQDGAALRFFTGRVLLDAALSHSS